MAVGLGRAPSPSALKSEHQMPRGTPALGLMAERRAAFQLQLVNIYDGSVVAAAGVKELPTPH